MVGNYVSKELFRGFESLPLHRGRLAQLGEHLPYKQGVTGSIPVASIGESQGNKTVARRDKALPT